MNEPDYDFLNEPAPDDVPEVAPEPSAPVESAPVIPEATAAPTAAPPRDESHVPLAALKAEREKRQQYERELQALRQRQAQPEAPSFYEAPEQYVAQVEQRAVMRMNAAFEADLREQNPDYDEVIEELKDYAQGNPAVLHQVFNAPNPPRAAYKLGKQIRELQAMKDPDAYRKGIEAEVRAKLEAEYAAKEAERVRLAGALPPDLSSARSPRDTEVVADDSLESILKSPR